MIHSLEINGRQFELHPAGVLYWKDRSLLFVSDVHLGKVTHFRKYGAAIPRAVISGNFNLLDACLDYYAPKAIYFLGDLFHSYINSEWKLFESWVRKSQVPIVLVAGNHDIISPLRYEALGIQVVQEVVIEQFLFTHHPEIRQGYFVFSGHIHPAIKLRGKGRQSLRLPCFFKSSGQMILPAFGAFTGAHVLSKEMGDEVFAIADQQVFKI